MLVASGGSEGEFDLRGVLGVAGLMSLFARGRLRRVADADSPFYTRSGFDPPKGPLRTGTIRPYVTRGRHRTRDMLLARRAGVCGLALRL